MDFGDGFERLGGEECGDGLSGVGWVGSVARRGDSDGCTSLCPLVPRSVLSFSTSLDYD